MKPSQCGTKFELMICVDAETPIGFTIPHHARPRRRGDRVAIRFAAVRESEGGTFRTPSSGRMSASRGTFNQNGCWYCRWPTTASVQPVRFKVPAAESWRALLEADSVEIDEAKSIPLRSPIPSTSRVSGLSAPGPVTHSTREPSRAGCILFSDGDRSTNGTGFRDISSKRQEIRMRHDSVRDVDDEIVGRIAGTPLR